MADRYPVIAGTWDGSSAAIWAASKDGVAGSAAAPTSADNVIWDFSGAGFSITIATGAVCNDLTMAAPGSGNWTMAGSGAMSIFGSLTLYSGLSRTYTGTITFAATTIGKTITCAGKSFGAATGNTWLFNGVGGGWVIQDTVTINNVSGNPGTIFVQAGALDTNNQTINCPCIDSTINTSVRSISLGSSVINMAPVSGGNTWRMGTSNLTVNTGTSTINITTSTTGTQSINAGTSSFALYNLTITNSATYSRLDVFGSDIVVSNNLTITGLNAHAARMSITATASNATLGVPKTITCNGVVSLTNVDFEDIIGAGTAVGWGTGTSIGDGGGNSGITFTPPVTAKWRTDTGNLSDPTKWDTGLMPLPQDTAVFDASSFTAGSKTVTNDIASRRMCSMDWSAATNAPTFTTTNALLVYGSYTLASGVILSGVGALTFRGRGSYTLTTATKTLDNLTMNAFGGTLTLQDALTVTNAVTHSRGTLNTAGQSVTSLSYASASALTATLTLGSTLWILTGTGNVWNVANSLLTITANTSTIKTTDASASSKTFIGGGKSTYYNLWFSGAGSGNFIITGSNSFNQIRCNEGAAAHTLQFTAGTTTTLAGWAISGAAGNVVTIGAVTAANFTITYAGSGAPFVGDYLSISRMQFSLGYKMFAGPLSHSTDGGNNARVIFAAPGANKPQLLS